jgi:hypothetical protein
MKPAVLILLVFGLLLPSCKSKRDQCALATDAVVKKKADAQSSEEHAKLIEETISELRGMQFKEKKLESALKSYIGALGALKDPGTGKADLAATLTYLESSRRRVADECNR